MQRFERMIHKTRMFPPMATMSMSEKPVIQVASRHGSKGGGGGNNGIVASQNIVEPFGSCAHTCKKLSNSQCVSFSYVVVQNRIGLVFGEARSERAV